MLAEQFGPFLGVPYNKFRGPSFLRVGQEYDPRQGINCQFLMHWLYRERLGVTLPIGMWSKEIFEDELFFEKVVGGNRFTEADIFVFTSDDNIGDPSMYHLAYFTGFFDQEKPLLVQANFLGTSEIWPLDRFASLRRYKNLMAIKRLRTEYRPHLYTSPASPANR